MPLAPQSRANDSKYITFSTRENIMPRAILQIPGTLYMFLALACFPAETRLTKRVPSSQTTNNRAPLIMSHTRDVFDINVSMTRGALSTDPRPGHATHATRGLDERRYQGRTWFGR